MQIVFLGTCFVHEDFLSTVKKKKRFIENNLAFGALKEKTTPPRILEI